MATNFNKSLKTITVKTIGGNTITAADTVNKMIASAALSEFEMGKTMHIKTGADETTIVPFHAVDNILVQVSTAAATRPDAYCKEP